MILRPDDQILTGPVFALIIDTEFHFLMTSNINFYAKMSMPLTSENRKQTLKLHQMRKQGETRVLGYLHIKLGVKIGIDCEMTRKNLSQNGR